MSVSCSRAAGQLGDLLAALPIENNWAGVEAQARLLANGLRTKGGEVDEHTAIGKTLLPQTLTTLLKAALDGAKVPDDARSPAVVELLRVGANLCNDHDENRGYLLEAGFPQTVLSLLEAYAESVPDGVPSIPLALSISHLRIIKTAIGVLLNVSLQYEPVQTRLISLEAAATILRLSAAIYLPGSWTIATDASSSETLDSWCLRSRLTDWSWRAISGLKDNSTPQPMFGPSSLPFLVSPLRSFLPPFSTTAATAVPDARTRRALITIDIEVLGEVCELLESLSLDVEDVRLALARGMTFPEEHGGHSCLETMLDFVESGDYPPYWSDEPDTEPARRKTMDWCKAAVVKAIVETAGEEKNTDVLWDISESDAGFVSRMISWLRKYQAGPPSDLRDDLIICSTISLGNLVRRENHSVELIKPPVSLAPQLVPLLRPEVDLKVKHGAMGLFKHLSQAPANRPLLGKAGVIQGLVTSQVFADKADIAEIVQMGAIGVAKHLCTGSVENSIALALPADGLDGSDSGLEQILSLVRRSDSIAVKSEGTRVLVNVVKSLFSNIGDVQDQRRQTAIKTVTTPRSAAALAQLLGRSRKYTILINEAIVSLLLLALQPSGAIFVLDAVVTQLPSEIPLTSVSQGLASDNVESPIVAPQTALDMIVLVLRNAENRFPAEVRVNTCTLLAELGKNTATADRNRETIQLRDATKAILESTAGSSESMPLADAARKALNSWN